MTNLNRPGIYQIINRSNGKIYIGSAVNIRLRLKKHRQALRKKTHHSRFLQRSWKKYGPSSFTYDVLEFVEDKTLLIAREQHWIDALNPAFNECPRAGSSLGYRHSEETKAKLRLRKKPVQTAALRRLRSKQMRAWYAEDSSRRDAAGKWGLGYRHTDDARARISASRKGKPLSQEHRKKLSESHKGHKQSPECVANRVAKNTGQKRSLETRSRMSMAQRNVPNKRHKLDPDKVREIRRRLLAGERHSLIAVDFSVKPDTIASIRDGHAWRHVTI